MTYIVTALASRHDVGALCLRGPDEPDFDPRVAAECVVAESVPREEVGGILARGRHRARVELARLRGWPGWAARWGAGTFAERVQHHVDHWRPDVVHMEYHVMGQFAGVARHATDPGVRLVLTSYEPGAASTTERAQRSRGYHALRAHAEAALWRRFERRTLRAADAAIVFSERDRIALQPLAGSTPLVTIPFGVTVPVEPLDPAGAEPPSLLFAGNFRHPPNVDAALHLVLDVAPRVWRKAPTTRVTIVGPHPPASVMALAGPLVTVTGEVDDVAPYLDRAAIVVAPIRTGGGIRVKVLEALAAGKAVVGTSRAAEGLSLTDGEQLRIADEPDDFASAVIALLNDRDARCALARRGRAWAGVAFGPGRLVDAYETVYEMINAGAHGAHRQA